MICLLRKNRVMCWKRLLSSLLIDSIITTSKPLHLLYHPSYHFYYLCWRDAHIIFWFLFCSFLSFPPFSTMSLKSLQSGLEARGCFCFCLLHVVTPKLNKLQDHKCIRGIALKNIFKTTYYIFLIFDHFFIFNKPNQNDMFVEKESRHVLKTVTSTFTDRQHHGKRSCMTIFFVQFLQFFF